MKRTAYLGMTFFLIALACFGRNQDPPERAASLHGLYGQNPPSTEIIVQDFEVLDANRSKTLPFRATYPAKPGPHPVIVWSHGLYGSQDFYRPLVEHWAKHGYLVLQPSHSDSIKRGTGRPAKGMAGNTRDWASRAEDVTFLLDKIPTLTTLAARADLTRIGIGGHSFGAHTTLLIEGAQPALGQAYRDPRPMAFVAISPQGESRLLNSSSWKGLERPTLFITGDRDDSPTGDKAVWRLAPFEKSPAGNKSLLWVKDAYHNFGGITGQLRRGAGPANSDHVELVKSATVAFWDTYLKQKPAAAQALKTGEFGGASRALTTWRTR